jgi:hypothetical protein
MSSLVVTHEVRQVGLEVRDKAIAVRSGRNSCSNTGQICTTTTSTPYHDPETHAFAQDMSSCRHGDRERTRTKALG